MFEVILNNFEKQKELVFLFYNLTRSIKSIELLTHST